MVITVIFLDLENQEVQYLLLILHFRCMFVQKDLFSLTNFIIIQCKYYYLNQLKLFFGYFS